MLFRRQLLNSSQDFVLSFKYFNFHLIFKYETIETHARAFFTLNILFIGTLFTVSTTKVNCCMYFRCLLNMRGNNFVLCTYSYVLYLPHGSEGNFLKQAFSKMKSRVKTFNFGLLLPSVSKIAF